jgi:hypothetical protein
MTTEYKKKLVRNAKGKRILKWNLDKLCVKRYGLHTMSLIGTNGSLFLKW